MMRRITEQKAEMESLVQGLEGLLADLEGSVRATGGERGGGVDDLKAEIWQMESEVKAAGAR